jgi:hypothetical protein
VQLRREKEWQDALVKKYYTEQRNSDAAAREALKAPVRRREREAKERQAEIHILESMYRVCCVKHSTDCHSIKISWLLRVVGSILETFLQTRKQQELAQLRTAEENDLATTVLDQHAKEQRERGEIAELHAKHETLREYVPMPRLKHYYNNSTCSCHECAP